MRMRIIEGKAKKSKSFRNYSSQHYLITHIKLWCLFLSRRPRYNSEKALREEELHVLIYEWPLFLELQLQVI